MKSLPNTATVDRVIDLYCNAWSEDTPAGRTVILANVWAEHATYTDPNTHVRGIDALVAHIGHVLARRPGSRVFRSSAVDAHHGWVRFAWRAVRADGSPVSEGLDVAQLADDGKLERIVGFFGPLPLTDTF